MSFLKQAFESMSGLLDQQKHSELLESVEALLSKDPNNAQLLFYRLRALDGLGKGLSDIGFLRKYCWYRSLDAWGFFMLSKAYLLVNERLNAIVALVYANSIEPENNAYSKALCEILKLEGYKDVKVAILRIDRIGHLAFESDMWLRYKKIENLDDNILYLFISNEETEAANPFCYELICRYITVLPNPYWVRIIKTRPSLLNERFYCSIPYDSIGWSLELGSNVKSVAEKSKEMQQLCQRCTSIVSLKDEDIEKAKTLLIDQGINPEKPIVCLHVRDSAYLESVTNGNKDKDVRKHDYRDADIRNYLPTIQYLLDQGYTVIRMGTVTNQPLVLEHSGYFEFFNTPLDSLLEVYLVYICKFYVGTTSGPFALASLFDKPYLVTNGIPLIPYVVGYSRTVPKVYLNSQGEELNFIELMENTQVLPGSSKGILDILDGHELQRYGFTWRENSASEILHSTIEFENELETHVVTLKTNQLQSELLQKLSDKCVFKTSKSHITGAFIRDNQHLF